MTRLTTIAISISVLVVGTATAGFAPSAEERCQAGRAKAAGKYARCIQNEIGTTYLRATTGNSLPNTEKFGKCVTKYAATWTRLQAEAAASPATETCDAARYVDNPDGTVTDNLTALQWEKKTSDATVHDKDNSYSWTDTVTAADGTAFTTFLAGLNGAGFAGQYDWRLPTLAELASIMQPLCPTAPCIDPIFDPIGALPYWSSTSDQVTPSYAWFVIFENGFPVSGPKSILASPWGARAVRGGF
jgi:uncharacterized protein DUF1566